MRNKRNSTIATTIGLIVVLVAGYLMVRDIGLPEGRPLTTLSPRGEKSQSIQNLIIPVFAIAGLVFVLVEVGLIWLATRFRRDPSDVDGVDEPEQVHGNTKLEIGWTIFPAVLLAVLAVFNVQTILAMDDAEDPLEVTVIGQQWWWEYRYDVDANGTVDIITANEAVIPVGRDVVFKIQSNDVIHSFWIPALAGKLDAVPGRTHERVLQSNEVGLFQGQCTEYCGLSHGVMRMQVKALETADYDEWIDRMTTPPAQPAADDALAIAGQELFVTQCSFCHQVNGLTPDSKAPFEYAEEPDPDYGKTVDITLAAGNAPNLTHFMMRDYFAGGLLPLYEEFETDESTRAKTFDAYVKAVPDGTPDENNIKAWLRDPEDVKPMNPNNNQGMPNYNLSEEQIEQLTAFLLTLK
ncbi:MAG: cytochrome c oxidase subunit II [Actinomycetota bacterium]|nr:cytochrome c oxidase subunit II [Actinomycetota bacterium]